MLKSVGILKKVAL